MIASRSMGEQDREFRLIDDVMGDAAEDAFAQTGVAIAAHREEIGADRRRLVHQRRAHGMATGLDNMGFAADAVPGEVVLSVFESGCVGSDAHQSTADTSVTS